MTFQCYFVLYSTIILRSACKAAWKAWPNWTTLSSLLWTRNWCWNFGISNDHRRLYTTLCARSSYSSATHSTKQRHLHNLHWRGWLVQYCVWNVLELAALPSSVKLDHNKQATADVRLQKYSEGSSTKSEEHSRSISSGGSLCCHVKRRHLLHLGDVTTSHSQMYFSHLRSYIFNRFAGRGHHRGNTKTWRHVDFISA